jgi:hypothetical protein
MDIFFSNGAKLPELRKTDSSFHNCLLRNKGDGTFTDVTDQSGLGEKPAETLSVQAAWFDYDNDGLLDLVVANYTRWTPRTDKRCQRGPWTYTAARAPTRANILNHPTFGTPQTLITSSSFAAISSTISTARQIQMGLKLIF